ncbi:MAG: putative tRNA/rRNA methyltransferase YfiF [Sodalis sp.]|uniref:tRNA/rRNA methyltransferase n=1 Tax=Sodalis sp. (in: enterobacteria) TaxID=1898979 RepID=UPI003873BA26|nr:MAG: putative tRNA/rRNA methyltransferase YfiF [Sodalis sp.]
MSDSDTLKGKNGKVRVMYVRKEECQASTRRTVTRSSTTNCKSGQRDEDRNPWRVPGDRASGGARAERTSSSGDALRCARQDAPPCDDSAGRRPCGETSDSPWKTFYAGNDVAVHNHGGISGKSQIDPEQLRRQRAEETRVYGENACQALFRNRPDAIVRAWFEQSVTLRFRDTLRWMAANRKAYHVVEDNELAKASGTDHHGGVCFLIKKRAGLDADGYLTSVAAKQHACVMALEQINNPHNLGAILRSCAHFGVNGVMMSDSALLESGAAVRTAEGGAEYVKAIQCDDMLQDMQRFQCAGYTVVTLAGSGGTPLSKVKMPARSVLVLAEEGGALSQAILSQADIAVVINGTGRVPNLNVSVSAGILLAEWWRQNRG